MLLPLLLVGLVSAQNTVEIDDCDVLDKNVKKALDKLFSRLPAVYTAPERDGEEYIFPTLFKGKSTITGLNHLQSDRPYQAFCRGHDSVVHFSVMSTLPLEMTAPWSLCGRFNGSFSISAKIARYEGNFVVTKSPEGRPLLSLTSFIPTLLEWITLGIGGVSYNWDKVSEVLGHVFSGPVRLIWVDSVTSHIRTALVETLSTLQ